jgi:transposase
MISDNNIVRIIDEIINHMDLKISDFANTKPGTIGRPAHNPILLLKLYVYSYFNGIRSSRKIEKECTRNIELKWLMGEIVPDHKCISNFRKDNAEAIKKTFREFLTMCDMLGLLGKTVVAIDGTKIRASNSKGKCYTPNKLQEMLNYFEKRVVEYEKILNENDEKESKTNTLELNEIKLTEIKEKLKKTREKIDAVTKQKAKMESEKQKQVTITDTDSRLMKSSNKGYDVAYNSQIAVDSKNHIIIATDVTNEVSDVEQLNNMVTQAIDNLGIENDKNNEKIDVLADKGYYSASELLKCEEDERINVIVAVPSTSAPLKDEKYNIENFKYNENEDTIICPEGNILLNSSKPTSKEQIYKNINACKNCDNRINCTKAIFREISRNEKSIIKEEAKLKLINNMDKYAKRQNLVEHPFGTIKRNLGFTYYLTRGIEKVKTENILHILAYNFKRLINIFKNKEEICLIEQLAINKK